MGARPLQPRAVRDLKGSMGNQKIECAAPHHIVGSQKVERAAHHIVRRKENPAPSKQGPQRTHVAVSAEQPRDPGAQQPRDPRAQQPRVGRDAALGDRVLPGQQGLFERPHQFFPISHRGASLHGLTGLLRYGLHFVIGHAWRLDLKDLLARFFIPHSICTRCFVEHQAVPGGRARLQTHWGPGTR